MAVDVRIVGMVCDPEGQLWAVSSGFATRNSELLKVDRTTGVETLVGESVPDTNDSLLYPDGYWMRLNIIQR